MTTPDQPLTNEQQSAPNLRPLLGGVVADLVLSTLTQHSPSPYTKADMDRAYEDEAERMRGCNEGVEEMQAVEQAVLGSVELTPVDREKVAQIRAFMPGYILGVELTPFLTDAEVLEVAALKDRLAAIHNKAFSLAELEKRSAKRKEAHE